ncbi:MAG: SBBP repeat-containing protein [Bacteroidota bacterium]|nr:SBBP repeat-containing protein [Bacteroidota bacterium]
MKIYRSLFFTLFLSFCFTMVYSQKIQWLKQAGGSAEDRGFGIAVSDSGNIFVTGYFKGDGFFGTTKLKNSVHEDVFIAKYDKNGKFKWANQAGSLSTDDDGQGVAVDKNENCYVIGFFEGKAVFDSKEVSSNGKTDIFVAKYNSNGIIEWVINIGGKGNDLGRSISLDGKGNCYITGKFEGTANFGDKSLTSSGGEDIFICKINSENGKILWANSGGSKGNDDCFSISTDYNGNSYIAGGIEKDAKFDNITMKGSGSQDIFLAKYNTNGKLEWIKSAEGESTENARSVVVEPSGKYVYITGVFSSETVSFDENIKLKSAGVFDMFIAKYDSNGILQWAKSEGGPDHDGGLAITVDKSGNSYVTGYFKSTARIGDKEYTSNGDLDVFIAKFNPNGSVEWVICGGGSMRERADGIGIDKEGNIYFAGSFEDTFTFDNVQIKSKGSKDIFIGKCLNK